MTNVPRISLIIPAYNEEKYIGACLDNAIKNSGGLFCEIIVVNNKSTDGTERVARNFHEVKVVNEEKKGLTSARQCGFMHATGDILAYVDADTLPPVGWAKQIAEEFSKDPHLALLSGPYYYHDIPLFYKICVKIWYLIARPLYLFTGYMATGGNFAIRKDVLQKMNGFDTSIAFYGEDIDVARRARAFGRVAFNASFCMPTSGRRLVGDGYLKTAYLYGLNFFSQVIKGKAVTDTYKDIR